MIVHVAGVHCMQAAIVQVIDMGAVLNGQVLFAGMPVRMCVGGHVGDQFLRLRIGGAHLQHMLVDMAVVRMVHVAVMEKIEMARVLERLVAASLAVGMAVMTAVEHLMCNGRGGKQGERQRGAKQGSKHVHILHEA